MSFVEPTVIYLIEQRRAPSKNGPWPEWSSEVLPKGAVMPRARTCADPLTPEQCAPRCMGIGYDGNPKAEVWQELRCIPFYRVQPSQLREALAAAEKRELEALAEIDELRAELKLWKPEPLVLLCPACGKQHIDTLEADGTDWSKRPHKKHLCKNTSEGPDTGCGHLWSPRQTYTVGVLDLPDAAIDVSEVPELGADFFKNARLTRPGEKLIDE